MAKQRFDVGVQILWMRQFFPQFKYGGRQWIGSLQPKPSSPEYRVVIEYRGGRSPRVKVLDPPIDKGAPHRYKGGYLCLFVYEDGSWNEDSIIAKTIVPWAAEWLYYYEIWLETGEWFGEEAPHKGPKRSD